MAARLSQNKSIKICDMSETITFEQLPTAVNLLNKKLDNIEKLLKENKQQPAEQPDQLLTVEEAAEFLNLKVQTIYTMTSRGLLPFMKKSKRVYFSRLELMEYLKGGRNKTVKETAKEADKYLPENKRR